MRRSTAVTEGRPHEEEEDIKDRNLQSEREECFSFTADSSHWLFSLEKNWHLPWPSLGRLQSAQHIERYSKERTTGKQRSRDLKHEWVEKRNRDIWSTRVFFQSQWCWGNKASRRLPERHDDARQETIRKKLQANRKEGWMTMMQHFLEKKHFFDKTSLRRRIASTKWGSQSDAQRRRTRGGRKTNVSL